MKRVRITHFNEFRIALVCALVVVAYTGLLVAQSLRPSVSIEAEQGAVSGQAAILSDSTASNSSYLTFTSGTPLPGTSFSASFASQSDLDRFTWQIQHGGVDPFPRPDQPRSWHADHDTSCAAPPTLRRVNLVAAGGPGPLSVTGGLAFWCAPGNDPSRGHLMTSTSLIAYGHIDFMPSQIFNNVKKVCWDMNRSDLGGRKWAQVSIIPEAAFQANGRVLDYVKPNLETDVAAAGAILPAGAFQLETFRSAATFAVGDGLRSGEDLNEMSLDAFGTSPSDRATRYPHCLVDTVNGVYMQIGRRQADGTIAWDDPIYQRRLVNGTVVNDNRFRFPTGQARVIFQDVSYDSIKGDFSMGGDPDTTNTWHWDNITIE